MVPMNKTNISHLQHGKYQIKSLIGAGGFGNTYLAVQVALGRKVAIKEFFMKEYCERDEATLQVIVPTEGSRQIVERYRKKFLKEAQMIASLKNEHIIQIYDIFEENNTAYYVMEYVEGGSLKDMVDLHGPLSENTAIRYISQVSNALSYLHSNNILHLDIKPSNILIDNEDNLLLIDFGISKHYDADGGQTSTTPAGISKGFAPIEQYQQGSISGFTPSTDIYSLGATLYFLITGQTPPEASIVNEDGLPDCINKFSSNIKNVIQKSMSPRRKDRFQTVIAFKEDLDLCQSRSHVIDTSLKSLQEEATIVITPSKVGRLEDKASINQQNNRRVSKVLIVIILLGVLIALAGLLVSNVDLNDSQKPQTEQIDYSKSKITFDDGKNMKTLSFNASGGNKQSLPINRNFTENVTFTNVPEWASVTYGNNTINVMCHNNNGHSREARVYLHRKGDGGRYATAQIIIKQQAEPKPKPKPKPVISHHNATLETGAAMEKVPVSLVISHHNATLETGENLQLSVKGNQGTVEWSSANSSIASVSSTGLIKAELSGNTTINAKVDGITLSCQIEVVPKPQSQNTQTTLTNYLPVSISRSSAKMSTGQTLQLYLYHAKYDFEWTSGNTEIATVSKSGLVTAKRPGKVLIWAEYPGDYRKCEITITY